MSHSRTRRAYCLMLTWPILVAAREDEVVQSAARRSSHASNVLPAGSTISDRGRLPLCDIDSASRTASCSGRRRREVWRRGTGRYPTPLLRRGSRGDGKAGVRRGASSAASTQATPYGGWDTDNQRRTSNHPLAGRWVRKHAPSLYRLRRSRVVPSQEQRTKPGIDRYSAGRVSLAGGADRRVLACRTCWILRRRRADAILTWSFSAPA